MPLRYEVDDWDIVFPLGMHPVGTYELAWALQLDFLRVITAIGVYVTCLCGWRWPAGRCCAGIAVFASVGGGIRWADDLVDNSTVPGD